MKFVESEWERRSLGIEVVELRFTRYDESYTEEARARARGVAYALARVPAGSVALVQALEDDGFRFLTTQVGISLIPAEAPDPPAYVANLCRRVESRRVEDRDELESLIAPMDRDMFNTDRVSLDPVLGPELALERHRHWIRDAFADGRNELHGIYLDRAAIGFFVMNQQSPDHYFASLAGVFTPHKGSGFGVSAIQLPIAWARERGVKRLTTRNSVNNPDSLKVHLAAGYRIDTMEYVLRRHNVQGG